MAHFNRLYIFFFLSILTAMMISCVLFAPISNTAEQNIKEFFIIPDSISDIPAEFTTYIQDHFPLRKPFVQLHFISQYNIWGRFEHSNVTAGKNGWLFYNPVSRSEPNAVNNYKGINNPSEEVLAEMKHDLEGFRDFLLGEEIDFVIMLSPNKANLYSEYLPDPIKRETTSSQGDIIAAYLRKYSNLCLIDPKSELADSKDGEFPTYFKLDSHWNQYGAYIGAKVFAKEYMGKGIEQYYFLPTEKKDGELSEMVYLSGFLSETNALRRTTEMNYSKTLVEGRTTSVDFTTIPAQDGHLFVIGDSFSVDFLPYLTEFYGLISYRRFDSDYYLAEIIETKPDVVMLELTERFFTPDVIHKTLEIK